MTPQIYKAQIDTPYGYFTVAAKTTKHDARTDILVAARNSFPCHPAMVKIRGEIKKSNRRIFRKMSPIKNCRDNDEFWGYFKRS